MKKIALSALLLILLTVMTVPAVLAQDAPKSVPMQMYQVVMMEKGPNWKSQATEEGMEIRMQVIENVRKAADDGLIVSAGLVNDETNVEFILIMNVETKTEAHTLLHGAPLIRAGVYKPMIYSWFAPADLKHGSK